MNLAELKLENVQTLHLIFRAYRSHEGMGSWFRGQADADWELLPKAGRPEYYLPDDRDLGRFRHWCNMAVAYSALPTNPIERLALAQHHGLATRLLDWSKNPLVACYFACWQLPKKDGAVYVYEMPEDLVTESYDFFNESHVDRGVFGCTPNAITPRLLNQRGMFTLHCDAREPIEVRPSRFNASKPNLVRVVIPRKLKKEVLKFLADYGVDHPAMFPDLDGLSMCVNTRTEDLSAYARRKSC